MVPMVGEIRALACPLSPCVRWSGLVWCSCVLYEAHVAADGKYWFETKMRNFHVTITVIIILILMASIYWNHFRAISSRWGSLV